MDRLEIITRMRVQMAPQRLCVDGFEAPIRHAFGQGRSRHAGEVWTIGHRGYCRRRAMDPFEQALSRITLAPYVVKATALIGVKRRGGSNMFRHQFSTLGILLDYKVIDPVLLKASVIHDLFEDAPTMPGVTKEEITGLDADGPAVYDLVMEVTRRKEYGIREPKEEYLLRIMQSGSQSARTLKLADRISNLTALGFVHEMDFVRRSLEETEAFILPYAAEVNADMAKELTDLVANRRLLLPPERRIQNKPLTDLPR